MSSGDINCQIGSSIASFLIEKDLYALGELVNVLNNRLQPISRAESLSKETEAGSPMPDVPLVNAIATADHMLRGSLHQLQDIIERLEV